MRVHLLYISTNVCNLCFNFSHSGGYAVESHFEFNWYLENVLNCSDWPATCICEPRHNVCGQMFPNEDRGR